MRSDLQQLSLLSRTHKHLWTRRQEAAKEKAKKISKQAAVNAEALIKQRLSFGQAAQADSSWPLPPELWDTIMAGLVGAGCELCCLCSL